MQINGMQEAFRMMVMNQTQEANSKIAGATNDVAKEKGLDMVVDVNTVFAGTDKLAGCDDLTDAVLKKLVPAKAAPAAAPAAPVKQ